MRTPLERTSKGKYATVPKSINGYSIDVYVESIANDYCDMFPDIDIIDLHYLFQSKFGFYMMRRLGRESLEELEDMKSKGEEKENDSI